MATRALSGPLMEAAEELKQKGFYARAVGTEDAEWFELCGQIEDLLGVHGYAQVDWARFGPDETVLGTAPFQDACMTLSKWGRDHGAGRSVWVAPFFGPEMDAAAIEIDGAALATEPELIAEQDPLLVLCKETGWCFVWRHHEQMRAGYLTLAARTGETEC